MANQETIKEFFELGMAIKADRSVTGWLDPFSFWRNPCSVGAGFFGYWNHGN